MRRLSLPTLLAFLRARGQAIGIVACAALFVKTGTAAPPELTLAGLSSLLGAESGTVVKATDIAWEPRGTALGEMLWGRPALFLGAKQGAPRDLYRARVRLTPGGQPIAVGRSLNLTETGAADEALLIGHGSHAAFVTVGRERVLSVTALAGLGAGPVRRTDLLVTGRAAKAELTLDPRRLTIDLGAGLGTEVYDVSRGGLTGEPRGGLRVLARDAKHRPWRLAIVDRAREVLGVRAVRFLGKVLFSATSVGSGFLDLFRSPAQPGRNLPIAHPLLTPGSTTPGATPDPLLHQRVVHPDGARALARLLLVTLDMRQLELGYAAGIDVPRASAGVPGDGRLPADPALLSRVVACFNGGDEQAGDAGGAVESGRLIALPRPDVPSVVITTGHELVFGRYPFDVTVPDHVHGLLQRGTPLVGQGAPGTEDDRSVRRRSALCATEAGNVIYAYAEGVDRASFRRALSSNGCVHALPLAASPEALGFSLARVSARGEGAFASLDGAMDFDAEATLRGSTRDFFYVMRRRTVPDAPAGAAFRPDGGTQPPPAFLPGIFAAETSLGGLSVRLFAVERGHADFRLRAGPREIGARGEPWAGLFDPKDAERALAVLELGHATAATRFGLVLGDSVPLAVKPAFATLVVGPAGSARVLLPGEAVTLVAGEQAVQLPLLADDRDVTQRARERGATRERAALCVAPGGRLLVASASHDSSDPLAVALRSLGCGRVLELDRGSHHPAFIHRAGTPTPPRTDYESSTLWALARPMRPAVVVVR